MIFSLESFDIIIAIFTHLNFNLCNSFFCCCCSIAHIPLPFLNKECMSFILILKFNSLLIKYCSNLISFSETAFYSSWKCPLTCFFWGEGVNICVLIFVYFIFLDLLWGGFLLTSKFWSQDIIIYKRVHCTKTSISMLANVL